MPTSSDARGVAEQTVNYFGPILKGAAQRISLSLDNRGPHKCSAWVWVAVFVPLPDASTTALPGTSPRSSTGVGG